MRLTDLMALSFVPRWSIVPMTRPQTVSDHSFRVLVIFFELCEALNLSPSIDDIRTILYHDGPESWSADIPEPFKNKLPNHDMEFAEQLFCPWYKSPISMDSDLYCVFKLADRIECYTWLRMYGDGPTAQRALTRIRASLDDNIRPEWATVVNKIIADIVDEEGRLGRREEASR